MSLLCHLQFNFKVMNFNKCNSIQYFINSFNWIVDEYNIHFSVVLYYFLCIYIFFFVLSFVHVSMHLMQCCEPLTFTECTKQSYGQKGNEFEWHDNILSDVDGRFNIWHVLDIILMVARELGIVTQMDIQVCNHVYWRRKWIWGVFFTQQI